EARGGVGGEGDRGDGRRRRRALPLRRVRGPGRDARRRARLRPRRAGRLRHGRAAPARGRGERRARPHPPAPARRAAPALPHPRPRPRPHGALRLRPHGPAPALRRPHGRHADRPRGQRLPLRCARGGGRVRAGRERPRARTAALAGREAGAAAPGERRARPRRAGLPFARRRDPCETPRRARRPDRDRARAVGDAPAQRLEVDARREVGVRKLQSQGVHHITLVGADRQTSIDFWEGVLGMPFVFEQPNLDRPSESHLYFDPGDGRLITVFTNEERTPDPERMPTDPGCVHHIAFSLSQATFRQAVERLDERGIRHSGVKDRGFMDSIYFEDPLGLLIELSSYRFEPPPPFTHADVLLEAHRLRVERGDYNIAEVHLADAIELLVARSHGSLSDDRAPKHPYRTQEETWPRTP